MGIDPGSLVAGISLIKTENLHPISLKKIDVLDVLTLKSSAKDCFNDRVGHFHLATYHLIQQMKPDYCVIESCFYGKNVQSALKLGQIRGAIISAIKRFKLPVIEISPTEMKKAITGHGHAGKEDVSFALKNLIGFQSQDLSHDATDALGLALTFLLNHHHYTSSNSPYSSPKSRKTTSRSWKIN